MNFREQKPFKKANRTGSAKRNAKQNNERLPSSTIASMFASSGKNNEAQNNAQIIPKRSRGPKSPDSSYERSQPYKKPNVQPPTPTDRDDNKMEVTQVNEQLSFRDAALLSLQFVICLAGRPPNSFEDAKKIKRVLFKKIEEAIVSRTASPLFKYHVPKDDGLYVGCSDSTCADWLHQNMVGIIPWDGCKSKIMVMSQSEPPKLVRTVVCVPTRNRNEYILDIFTQLNKNLNVKEWIIKARRPMGAFKTSLFIRMDEESVKRLKSQNYKANWILGTVQVNLEKENRSSQPASGNPTSVETNATVSGGNRTGSSSSAPTQSVGSKAHPSKQRLTQKGGSTSKGSSNSAN